MNTATTSACAAVLAVMLMTAGCGEKNSPQAAAGESSASPAELVQVFTDVTPPAGMSTIPELRNRVEPGDEVVFEAKVMGTLEPFVDNRALFVVGDEATITSCDLLGEDDHCATPWDACCEDRDNLRNGTATIQVVDADGKVLHAGIRGVKGLSELSRVRISGVVAPGSSAEALIINASAIQIL